MNPASGIVTTTTTLGIGALLVHPDITVLLTVAAAICLAIIAGIATYVASMRQTREEIKQAFDDHLAKQHEQHEQAVEAVTDRDAG